jgi:hypothetical protein
MSYAPLADRRLPSTPLADPPTDIKVPTTNKTLRYGLTDTETGEVIFEDLDWTTAMVIARDRFCSHYDTWEDPDVLLFSMDNFDVCHIPY